MKSMYSWLNNKQSFYSGGSPFKPSTMTQGSALTNSKRTFDNPSMTCGGMNNCSSGEWIARKKRQAIGKNSSRIGYNQMEATSYANINKNDVKSALSKVRSGGSIAPAKKGFKY
jgi:hypothetical protein